MNFKKLEKELTKGFMLREYYILFPEMQIMAGIEEDAIIKYIETKTEISNILDLIKNNKSEMNSFFTILLNWESSHLSDYIQKKTILDEIKWFKTASTYNNMPSERFFALIQTTLGN